MPIIIRSHEKSHISPDQNIGDGTVINSHVWLGPKVVIGDNCKIQAFAFIPDGVTLRDRVFIGPHACFTNDKRPPSNGRGWAKTLVEEGAVIGAGAVILPGLTIGKGAVIGAGTVVTKDVPAGETWVGNPARRLT